MATQFEWIQCFSLLSWHSIRNLGVWNAEELLASSVKELLEQGKEVILVTSGAVGVGKQMLGHQTRLHSSFSDLGMYQEELDGKACAALGQIRLMALYKTFFELLGGEAAQMLVTETDFKDRAFRSQLSLTVGKLLRTKVVPVFNENDAISTRDAPYKDPNDKIFWDNDSLGALLAEALNADLLIILSDVEGLYTGPPSNKQSKIIHMYLEAKHKLTVTFGEKSKVGRGGMTAKVEAALFASNAGIPTVIGSGYEKDTLRRMFKGERVGTLFHQHANQWASLIETGARELAIAAKNAGARLQVLSPDERRQALLNVADALVANETLIMAENEADVEASRLSKMSTALTEQLTIKPGKVRDFAESFRAVADTEDPVGKVLQRTEVSEGLILEKTYSPIGVVLVIGARPEAVVQIASLAIRSGNGLLWKGGEDPSRSNTILHKIITEALPQSVGSGLIGLVSSRDKIPDLLKMDDTIDLVIPRGSSELVSNIMSMTKIPCLGYSDGVCHVYVDKDADIGMAEKIVYDSKLDYPFACNSMETLLVHESLVDSKAWEPIYCRLQFAGVKMYGGPRAVKVLKLEDAKNLQKEYSEAACTVEIVEDVFAAIKHINKFGSGHTDCIVTEDDDVAEMFLQQVASAAIFRNASTRFCDGARFGLGAEVGITTSKSLARGPLGVEGLLLTRWLLRGHGQIVDGDKGVAYTHKHLSVEGLASKLSASKLANGGDILSNGNGYVHDHA